LSYNPRSNSNYGNVHKRYGFGGYSKKKTKPINSDGRWVTFNKKHIFVRTGEYPVEVYERLTGKPFDVETDEFDVREGKVDLSVFEKEKTAKELTEKILSELPSEQTKGITVDVRSDFGLANVEGFTGAKVLADYGSDEFNPKKGSLTVSANIHDTNKLRARLAVFHEVGHHIYRTYLSPEDKADWDSFWVKNKVVMPSDYARIRPSEGFAEAYGNWQENPGSMGPDVNRWFSKRLKWRG